MEIDASLRSVILDAVACGVAVLDRDGRVLVWNRWMVRHSGLPDDIAIGRLFVELFPEITGSRFGHAIDMALSHRLAGIVSPSIHKPPLPLYRNSSERERNERLQQLIHISPIRLGGSAACTIQVQDVTAAVNRENRLRDQSAELATHNQQLTVQLDEIRALQAEIALRDAQDPLTNVLNRKHLDKQLLQMLTAATPFAALIVDPDNLKQVNLDHGFAAGDAVLVTLAGLMKRNLPAGAVLGRHAADEFLLLLPDRSLDQAAALAQSWRTELARRPPVHDGKPLPVTFSAGIAAYPLHGHDKATLIQCLDLSLFLAKQDGGASVVRYDHAQDGLV